MILFKYFLGFNEYMRIYFIYNNYILSKFNDIENICFYIIEKENKGGDSFLLVFNGVI